MSRMARHLHDTKLEWKDFVVCDGTIAEKTEKTAALHINKRTSSPSEAVEQLREMWRISELERKVSVLTQDIEDLKSQAKNNRDAIANRMSDPRLLDVIQITKNLFTGNISLDVICDPTEPDDPVVVFQVSSAECVKQIVQLRREWHRRVAETPMASSGRFSLSVVPVE